ncbi:hypothetical protein OE88DRAFT_1662483, partial [Heliocybe sulcata]
MAFAPISMNTMPVEIVEKIFVDATNIRRQQDRMRVLLMMTHISRKVREIVTRKRELWNFINTDKPALAAMFLERSAQPDVSLALTEPGDEQRASEFFDVLELYSEKIVSLHIDIPGALWERFCTERAPEMWQMTNFYRRPSLRNPGFEGADDLQDSPEKLSLRLVNRPAAEVFTHLIHPGKARINLDIISDDLD